MVADRYTRMSAETFKSEFCCSSLLTIPIQHAGFAGFCRLVEKVFFWKNLGGKIVFAGKNNFLPHKL